MNKHAPKLDNGMNYQQLSASLTRVFKQSLGQIGHMGAEHLDEAETSNYWWRWLQSFLSFLRRDEGSFDPQQVALDARASYLASRGPRGHPFEGGGYLDVFEACVRHVFHLAESDARISQEELVAREGMVAGWLEKRLKKELAHATPG